MLFSSSSTGVAVAASRVSREIYAPFNTLCVTPTIQACANPCPHLGQARTITQVDGCFVEMLGIVSHRGGVNAYLLPIFCF